jgi:ABC-2 type transport system ATP-binding protein
MEPILEIKGLRKSYADFSLNDLSLRLEPGSALALVGPNGAGKTTFMKLLMGQIDPDVGTIQVCGHTMPRDLKAIRNCIGFVPEEPPLQQGRSVADIASFAAHYFENWDGSLLGELLDRFEVGVYQKVKEISKGRKMLLMLALALAHQPRLLLLDEPAAGLDVKGRRQVLKILADFVADGERAAIIATHQTDGLANLTDRLAVLHRGRLQLNGDTADVLASWRWVRFQGGALDDDIARSLLCREKGSFGEKGLLPDFEKHRSALAAAETSGDLHVGSAGIDDILVALTEEG